ncbi:MAG: CRISPR-associated endonuclease Cas2 [Marinosulfonomonas sp.]|nr:CRISPR-associated endonuclease Cas2 [Marinosulfonomonas sp.]
MVRRLFIVTYDIRCPKRWRRVFKLMKQTGEHQQLSVFLVLGEWKKIRKLTKLLEHIVDHEEDSIVIAPIDERVDKSLIFIGKTGGVPGPNVMVI